MHSTTNGDPSGSLATVRPVKSKKLYLLFGLLVLLSITSIALAAATLGVVINRLNSKNADTTGSTSLVEQIKAAELIKHLEQLQIIADQSEETRAIGTEGFKGTLDYITSQLEQHTNFIIQRESFTVPNSVVQGTPQLQSQTNVNTVDHVHLTDFTYISFSPSTNFDTFVRLVPIPNLGCQDADWINVSPADSVVLVKRGDCTFPDKATLAEKYGVRGLLIYNDGTAPDRFQPYQNIRTKMNATVPAFFLSYNLGMQFLNASGNNIVIRMVVNVSNAEGVENICADTPTGDKTKTIVIGAHSDGVLDGSGINDNGSGTVATLALALNLARLFQTSSLNYVPYRYRVRFCWWGAEEVGLLGSIYHVDQISLPTATTEGERLQDYLLYFNYDMLASPNYNYGISDNLAVPSTTPTQALHGTGQITNLFRQWFNDQNLPWTNSSLGGGSDFVPFLAKGIAVGGVNTGASGIKSASERDRYAALLGIGKGGIANAAYDSCYHQQCDRLTNADPPAFEKLVKAAAYALEYMGRLNDLKKWLYPQGRTPNLGLLNKNELYDVHNDPALF